MAFGESHSAMARRKAPSSRLAR
ncbi:MAG: hypothetical protein QOK01_1308, partial [Alphaproteobacteria bacterium]|nr:hypothetical protein [Alphaproteobacteria bacterium]